MSKILTTKLRIYPGDYLHVESLTGEKVAVDGVDFLVMKTNLGDYFRVEKSTEIVHMVDYIRVDSYGHMTYDGDWTISNGTVFVNLPGQTKPQELKEGTKYIILDPAELIDHDVVMPGLLGILYPDYNYPSL